MSAGRNWFGLSSLFSSRRGKAVIGSEAISGVHALASTMAAVVITGGTVDMVLRMCRERKNDDKIFFIGNGGSAAIANHMAADWMKNGGFRALSFSDSSLLTCVSNDIGYGSSFSVPIGRYGGPADLLFAISSSGASINILNGVLAAKRVACGL